VWQTRTQELPLRDMRVDFGQDGVSDLFPGGNIDIQVAAQNAVRH
jgi:hypothetical protein